MKIKKRLDVLLTERLYADSRSKAQAIIMSGNVYVNGQKADKAGTSFEETVDIEVRGAVCPYVSRGGLKLEKAMQAAKNGPLCHPGPGPQQPPQDWQVKLCITAIFPSPTAPTAAEESRNLLLLPHRSGRNNVPERNDGSRNRKRHNSKKKQRRPFLPDKKSSIDSVGAAPAANGRRKDHFPRLRSRSPGSKSSHSIPTSRKPVSYPF